MRLKSSREILWRTIRAARCRHAVARVLGKQSTALKTTGFATTATGLVQVDGGWKRVGSLQSSRTSEHSFFFFCCPAGQFRPPKQACLKTLSFLRLSPQSHHAIFNGHEIREELAEGDQFTMYLATGGVVTDDS
jgi:hypothetical protein